MIPKIDEISEIENFRRLYLYNKDFIESSPSSFLIETYSLPIRFIELQKQINKENDERDSHLKWIVHSDSMVYENIEAKSDVLKDFDHFKKDDLDTSGLKISRVLKSPLLFRQSVCQVSVFVWINNLNPFESYIFSDPLLTLLKEPEILKFPSIFNQKYTYKQVISGLK